MESHSNSSTYSRNKRETFGSIGETVDIFVENQRIVELKSLEEIQGFHEAQLLTRMKLAGVKIGLLMNFNVTKLKGGIKCFVR